MPNEKASSTESVPENKEVSADGKTTSPPTVKPQLILVIGGFALGITGLESGINRTDTLLTARNLMKAMGLEIGMTATITSVVVQQVQEYALAIERVDPWVIAGLLDLRIPHADNHINDEVVGMICELELEETAVLHIQRESLDISYVITS